MASISQAFASTFSLPYPCQPLAIWGADTVQRLAKLWTLKLETDLDGTWVEQKNNNIMASLNMNGPYPLTKKEIDKRITKKSAGNYAYGHTKNNTFYVEYVGRADSDLNDRIKHGIGQYEEFKYSYAKDAKAAFEEECRNYHDFGGSEKLDNEIHPDKPDNTNYECPYCDD